MSTLNYGTGRGLVLRFAAINASDAGDNTLVALTAGQKISVHEIFFQCSGAVTVSIESSGGTVLCGPNTWLEGSGVSLPYSKESHFQTAAGEALVMNLGGAIQVGGHLVYSLIP